MAMFGIPTTAYERRSGQRKKTKAQEAADRQTNRDQQATGALSGSQGNILSGTEKEQQGQLAGLNVGNIGYGQGLGETGQDIQRVKELQRQRTSQSGGDPVSAAIMGQKASAVANTQRNQAASGVKGGAATGAVDAVARQRDSDIAASLYGQQRQSIADKRSLAGNMLSCQTSLMQGEKAANVAIPNAPDTGKGTSFICTMLRSKGLMTPKESFIMTKFMIRSMFARANFLVWYFKHGKAAVDRAEKEGFHWAGIKTLFVDDIITLINEGKIVEAQNKYIHATGVLCSMYGAKGFTSKLTTPNSFAVLHFPRLFLNKVCREWLVANHKNVFKLIKA
jgi:hypothetical protein